MITDSENILRGGTNGKILWEDHLVFKRKSWFRELTLYYDLWYAKVESASPFYTWLSESEQRSLSKCRESYWVLAYALDNDKISHTMFREMLKKQGMEEVVLTQVEGHVRVHPDFDGKSLNVYKFMAYCDKKLVRSVPVQLNVPGFLDTPLQ